MVVMIVLHGFVHVSIRARSKQRERAMELRRRKGANLDKAMVSSVWLALAFALPCAAAVEDVKADLSSRLGTKTPYDDRKTNAPASSPPPAQCEGLPYSIQVLARHGARHTGKPSDLTELGRELVELGSPLPWLRTYEYPGTEDEANNLLQMGKDEHKGIGARVAELFGDSFFEEYNPNFLMINSTTLSRTGQSATSFCAGAGLESPFVRMDSSGRDDILRFYDHCEAWDDNTDAASAPYVSFTKTSDFKSAVADVSVRAELPPGVTISADQFNRAFEACAYDLILSHTDQQWCSLFIEGSLDVANYVTDLKKYYQYGPGLSINRDFTAFLMKSFIDGLESDAKTETKGTMRFAHAETLIPFLSALGIFDGQEVRRGEERSEATTCCQPRRHF